MLAEEHRPCVVLFCATSYSNLVHPAVDIYSVFSFSSAFSRRRTSSWMGGQNTGGAGAQQRAAPHLARLQAPQPCDTNTRHMQAYVTLQLYKIALKQRLWVDHLRRGQTMHILIIMRVRRLGRGRRGRGRRCSSGSAWATLSARLSPRWWPRCARRPCMTPTLLPPRVGQTAPAGPRGMTQFWAKPRFFVAQRSEQ